MLYGIKHLISMLIHFPTLQINKGKAAFFVLFLLYMCGGFFLNLGKSVRTEAFFYVAWYEQKKFKSLWRYSWQFYL